MDGDLALLLALVCCGAPAIAQHTLDGGVELGWTSVEEGLAHSDELQGVIAFDDSRVYVASSSWGDIDTPFVVRALDALDGTEVWQRTWVAETEAQVEAVEVLRSPAGDTVYAIGLSDGIGTDGLLWALDAVDGTERWSKVYNDSFAFIQWAPQAAALSPDGSRLFVAAAGWFDSEDLYVAAFDTQNGELDWTFQFSFTGSSRERPSDLVVDPDGARLWVCGTTWTAVVDTDDYFTFALDAANGQVLWSDVYGEAGIVPDRARAMAYDPASDCVLVAGETEGDPGFDELVAYDGTTGAQRWTAPIATGVRRLAVAPNGLVLAAGDELGGGPLTTRVRAVDGASGVPAWTRDLTIPSGSATRFVDFALEEDGGRLEVMIQGSVAASSTVSALEAATGADVWTVTLPAYAGQAEERQRALVARGSGAAARVALTGLQNSGQTSRDSWTAVLAGGSGGLEWSSVNDLKLPGSDLLEDLALAPDGDRLAAVVLTFSWGVSPSATHLALFDATNGTLAWGGGAFAFAGQGSFDRRVAFSPDGDRVYDFFTTFDGLHVTARDATDGSELWSVLEDVPGVTPKQISEASLVVTPDGSAVVALVQSAWIGSGSQDGAVCLALDDTGSLLWSIAAPSGLDPVFSSPPAGPRPLAAAPDSSRVYVALRAADPGGSDAFMRVGAIDAVGGGVDWFTDVTVGTPYFLVVDPSGTRLFLVGTDFFFGESTQLVVAALDTADGSVLWTATWGGPDGSDDLPVFAAFDAALDAVLLVASTAPDFVSSPDAMIALALDASNGSERWSYTQQDVVSPAFHGAFDPASRTLALGGSRGPSDDPAAFDLRDFRTVGLDADTGLELWRATFDPPPGVEDSVQRMVAAPGRIVAGGFGAGDEGTAVHLVEYRTASLAGAPAEVSIATGGEQELVLFAGAEQALDPYILLGSLSGTEPALPIAPGIELPLVVDPYFEFTLAKAGSPPLVGGLGDLDANGRASASLVVPATLDPALAGTTVHHAYVLYPGLVPVFASAAAPLVLVP